MWRLYKFTRYLMIQIITMKLNSVQQLELLLHNLKFMIKCGLQEMRLTLFKKSEGGVYHSQKGIELAKKIIEYLEENEGCAECFPYETIDKLKDEFIF